MANFVIERLSAPPLVATDIETAIDPSFLAPEDVDRLIATYEERTTEVSTPSDFLNLGLLYLEKARLTADPARYLQAEEALSQAAALSPEDPSPVMGLARTELALHDFAGAAETARAVLVDVPTRLDALAVVVDAEMALGNEDSAEVALNRLLNEVGEIPPVVVRQAQLAWLRGDDSAVRLAREAIPEDETNPRRLAFYEAYAANLAFLFGDVEEAKRLSSAALEHDPESITALTVSSRLAAAGGALQHAIDLLEQAVARVPDPELNGELGDIYQMMGNEEAAAEQFGLVEVIGTLAASQGVFNRQVARFYADHDLENERALQLASDELNLRRDALGYDTYAWTLYRVGRLDEALAAIDEAKASGFRDAELLYHEGVIANALGNNERARQALEESLALNPNFDLWGRVEARRLLAELN